MADFRADSQADSDPTKKKWSISDMPLAIREAAVKAADERRMSVAEIVTAALSLYLGQSADDPPASAHNPLTVSASGPPALLLADQRSDAERTAAVADLGRITEAMVALKGATGEPLDPRTVATLEGTARALAGAARPRRRKGGS